MKRELTESQSAVVDHMLQEKEYVLLDRYARETLKLEDSEVLNWIQLGKAILNVDIDRVKQLAQSTGFAYLMEPNLVERKVYFFTHFLQTQLHRKQYADYFRALTPVLVDLFRLIISHEFAPDIHDYMIPVVKNTVNNVPLYRGLQWHEKKIEADDNLVKQTFRRYYGDHFNYDHYVSSSHLLKLINDHSQNAQMRERVDQMRQIEKYVRNLTAHEVVCVDEQWIHQRVNMTIVEIHMVYVDLLSYAGLVDQRQWEIFDELENKIKKAMNL